MSVLAAIPNIKVPYASEGVIRTAQLDDTVAPQNSVQLAVNMNFDRVGAIQTRPGVTQYADDLVDAINNYGTLHNNVISQGYSALYQLGVTTDPVISTAFFNPVAVRVSATQIAVAWKGTSNHGFAQKFNIDPATGSVSAVGTATTFYSNDTNNPKITLVDDFWAIVAWTDQDDDGQACSLHLNSDNIVASTPYEFDTSTAEDIGITKVDATHAVVFYKGPSDDGIATILALDTGTGAISEPGSPTTFESGFAVTNSCALIDGTHVVNFWRNGSGGQAQCFEINTGTWAITALDSPYNFDVLGGNNHAFEIDSDHVLNMFVGGVGGNKAQAFAVATGSTYAITAAGTAASIVVGGNDFTGVAMGDGFHFVSLYSGNIGDGHAQLVAVDPMTYDASLVGSALAGFDFANGGYTTGVRLTDYEIAAVWAPAGGGQMNGAVLQTFGDAVEGRWLYAGSGDEVFNTAPGDAGAWVSRRSGLAQVSKPRFVQFLNYIWMVNGNDQLGGDPVATSNGGAFGTTLVPDGFPKGDFISAGFEGRVWVGNKTLGIIYYTDIVQFTPPLTYSLTFNPQVNFITTITPNTGENMTAIYRVPRALLIFTQNTITRIYGATSMDAYPAYNVGTYSQESIIETKTGIFFHHSSGFYQFDYGSQPVEISRRIIDFVKAIPRANYEDIVGIYDGFDCVKWYVGSVVVEGVVFANCMVRYTISTQVWTIYDYTGLDITALISYDDGEALNQIVGTTFDGDEKTATLDTGVTDLGQPFYWEFIDRWRSYANMYYLTKSISGASVYSENAAGANLLYQKQKSGPNAWIQMGTVTEANNSVMPNSGTEDFDVLRWRLVGTTKGAQVVVHGIEITQLTIKGQEQN